VEVRLDMGEGVGGGSVGVDSIMGYLWFVMIFFCEL
jgi:hypothetical protein